MPTRISSYKFCCCIPVRIGVFIIAILGLGFGGLIAAAGVIQLTRTGPDLPRSRIAYGVQIAVYGVYALMSLFALWGALAKRIRIIQAFTVVLVIHVLFSIASGAFSLYRYFQDAPRSVDACVNGSTDELVIKGCKSGVEIMKGVLCGIFVFVWLMEIWGCVIVRNYARQLKEEEGNNLKAGKA